MRPRPNPTTVRPPISTMQRLSKLQRWPINSPDGHLLHPQVKPTLSLSPSLPLSPSRLGSFSTSLSRSISVTPRKNDPIFLNICKA